MGNKYLFKSERLGFRNWEKSDIPKMVEISEDPVVMEFFPNTASPEETIQFVRRMQSMYDDYGFCYFAVERLEDQQFIGYIGMLEQIYEADFTPCMDIGWRLGKEFWNKGYATEGAERCLQYAFNELNFKSVVATAPEINLPSIKVMKKIGMTKVQDFKHPKLILNERLVNCVCYEIKRAS